jgi:hypothetical protein
MHCRQLRQRVLLLRLIRCSSPCSHQSQSGTPKGSNMRRTAAVLVFLVSFAHAATLFDLSADFSFQKTPTTFGSMATPPRARLIRLSLDSTGTPTHLVRWGSGIRASAAGRGQDGIPTWRTTPQSGRRWVRTMDGRCALARSLWKAATPDSTV